MIGSFAYIAYILHPIASTTLIIQAPSGFSIL